jgi:hypothetical protein
MTSSFFAEVYSQPLPAKMQGRTPGIPRSVKDIEALMKKDGIPQVLKKSGAY